MNLRFFPLGNNMRELCGVSTFASCSGVAWWCFSSRGIRRMELVMSGSLAYFWLYLMLAQKRATTAATRWPETFNSPHNSLVSKSCISLLHCLTYEELNGGSIWGMYMMTIDGMCQYITNCLFFYWSRLLQQLRMAMWQQGSMSGLACLCLGRTHAGISFFCCGGCARTHFFY